MARTERRVVTVVFADIVGFTTLAERLDAEDVALVQDGYFTAAGARRLDHADLETVSRATAGKIGRSPGRWEARQWSCPFTTRQ